MDESIILTAFVLAIVFLGLYLSRKFVRDHIEQTLRESKCCGSIEEFKKSKQWQQADTGMQTLLIMTLLFAALVLYLPPSSPGERLAASMLLMGFGLWTLIQAFDRSQAVHLFLKERRSAKKGQCNLQHPA